MSVPVKENRPNMRLETNDRRRTSDFYFYLGDDLAVLRVDLSDASPLRQEGKDLIELNEKDMKIIVPPVSVWPKCLHKNQILRFILEVAYEAIMSAATYCNYCVWSPEMFELVWDEVQ